MSERERKIGADGDRPKVLIIDDEVPIRRFLKAALSNADYKVIEAGSISEGRSLALCDPPDLLLLDLSLPDGHGMELIEWLHAWSRAPVIVLSASGQERDKVTALDLGATDYVTKPFGVAELLARIRAALRSRGRSDARRSWESSNSTS